MANYTLLFPICLPFILALILFKSRRSKFQRNLFLLAGVFINFALLYTAYHQALFLELHLFRFNELIDIYFKLDALGSLFAFLVSTLWIFTAFYSIGYMDHEHKQHRFFAFFAMTLGVTLGIAFSGNLITLYIFYELLTLCTFPLVIHTGTAESLRSGYKYLAYSFFGATLVLLGMIMLFFKTHALDFVPLGIIGDVPAGERTYFLITYIAMFVGFGVKAAIVPFHSWLPSAMVAPTPVSALLHAVAVVKSGLFALIRITYFIFGPAVILFTKGDRIVLFFILLTIVLGSFLAMHQKNLKKRLAYSTISQLGYIMLCLVIFNTESFTGGILHLIFHALIKITLFFCVGAIMHTTGKTELDQIHGLGKKMPKLMWCFSIASIALIGIPPLNGFVSKWYLAIGGLEGHSLLIPIVLLLSAFLTAGYLIPVISVAFFKPVDKKDDTIKEPGSMMLVPIMVLTAIIVVTGFYPNPLINMIKRIITL